MKGKNDNVLSVAGCCGEVDSEAPLTTDSFQASADLADGHSGVRKIDTQYEANDYELLRGEVDNPNAGD
jgi:hypothetical protein